MKRARVFYTGQLFQAAWAYAQHVLGLPDEQIFVLSALHGLTPHDSTLLYYDATLTRQSAKQRRDWAKGVLAQLDNLLTLPELTVYIFAGGSMRAASKGAPQRRKACAKFTGVSVNCFLMIYCGRKTRRPARICRCGCRC